MDKQTNQIKILQATLKKKISGHSWIAGPKMDPCSYKSWVIQLPLYRVKMDNYFTCMYSGPTTELRSENIFFSCPTKLLQKC